jgi:hypothetical protein
MHHALLHEFCDYWLPNISDSGLDRITELLATASPYLIHGAFSRCVPMGCLATHIAWNHPATEHLTHEAGITWLTKLAQLNPATSKVILAWDQSGVANHELRSLLLDACRHERLRRDANFESIFNQPAVIHEDCLC